MREIKFRFWDATTDGYEGQEPCMRYWPEKPQSISLDAWLQGQNPVMQYTGLKDKNGKEIYEGDIVKFGDTAISTSWDESHKPGFGEVRWHEDGRWEVKATGVYVPNYCIQEVIGNIYENPELLS